MTGQRVLCDVLMHTQPPQAVVCLVDELQDERSAFVLVPIKAPCADRDAAMEAAERELYDLPDAEIRLILTAIRRREN